MILKAIIALLVFLPAVASAMQDQIFQEVMRKVNSGDSAAVEAFLEKNRATYKRDPEYYVILLNYSISKQTENQTLIGKEEPVKIDPSPQNDATARKEGSLKEREASADTLVARSIRETREALPNFRDRLDIHLGIAHIAFKFRQWQSLGQQLLEIMEVSRTIDNKWRWGLVSSMSGNPREFMLDNVQSKINDLFQLDSEEADRVVEKVSLAMIKYYPSAIYGYSDLGTLYAAQKKYDLAEKYLNQAIALNPKDEIVKHNLELLKAKRK